MQKNIGLNRKLAAALLGLAGLLVSGLATSQPFTPDTLAADRSGFWAGGVKGADRLLAKFDNAGNTVFARAYGPTQGFLDYNFFRLVPLRDGGLIVIGRSTTGFDTLPGSYSFHRVDAAGNPVWSLRNPVDSGFSYDNISSFGSLFFGADDNGAIWFPSKGDLFHVDDNGVATDVGTIGTSVDADYAAATDPASGALYVVPQTDTNILDPQTIVRFDSNGSHKTIWTAPDASTVIQYLSVGSDGNVYVLANTPSAHLTLSVTPTGTVRWKTSFGSGLYAFSHNSTTTATQVVAVDAGGFVALDTSNAFYRVTATGQAQPITLPPTYPTSQIYDTSIQIAANGDIVFYDTQGNQIRVDANGNSVQTQAVVTYVEPTLLFDGTEVVSGSPTPNGPTYFHIARNGAVLGQLALDVTTTQPPLIRVDQSGIDGAWYAPAESGQGFVIDYLPAQNLIFMPWFTYNVSPAADASGLAWVTFQGSPAMGATSVDLVMATSNGGTFNSGIVPAQIVGSAKLTFSDCSNGGLQYKFNADTFGGQGGYMPLTRILASTTPCVLANGTTVDAQNPSTPINGFDARQSGSWYDPATSGQGMEFTIVPAGNGFGGFLFGAWFTFDAPPADDAAHQHWFTLQTGLASASNGSVTTSILQSVGGSLDSLGSSSATSVGTATVTLLGCDTATLAYHFGNTSAAGTFKNLSGTIHLSKVVSCIPQ